MDTLRSLPAWAQIALAVVVIVVVLIVLGAVLDFLIKALIWAAIIGGVGLLAWTGIKAFTSK